MLYLPAEKKGRGQFVDKGRGCVRALTSPPPLRRSPAAPAPSSVLQVINFLLNTPDLKCGCLCTSVCPTTGSGPCLSLDDYKDPVTGDWNAAIGSSITNKVGPACAVICRGAWVHRLPFLCLPACLPACIVSGQALGTASSLQGGGRLTAPPPPLSFSLTRPGTASLPTRCCSVTRRG